MLKKKINKKLIIQLDADIFGWVYKKKMINYFFKYLNYNFFKRNYRKHVDIFQIVELNRANFIKRPSRAYNLMKFRYKFQIRRFYQNLKKKQIVKNAYKAKKNVDKFFNIIECRIDMFLFRALIVFSLAEINQLLLHKNILVNNKIITYRSYTVNLNDIICFKKNNIKYYIKLLYKCLDKKNCHYFFKNPIYIENDFNFLIFSLIRKPRFQDLPFFFKFNVHYLFRLNLDYI